MKEKLLLTLPFILALSVAVSAQEGTVPDSENQKQEQQTESSPTTGEGVEKAEASAQQDNKDNAATDQKEKEGDGNTDEAGDEDKPKVRKEHPADKSYYEPSRNHNPMMSPRDYEKIRLEEQARRDAEEAERRAAEEAERMRLAAEQGFQEEKKVIKVDHAAVIARNVRVNGIVGEMALINGTWYNRGDVIKDPKIPKIYRNAVKLKTVGGNFVILEYKGKQIRKTLKN